MQIALSPFVDAQASQIAAWPTTAEETTAWAGDGTAFPVIPDHFANWHDDPDVQPFVGHHEDTLVAYGQLWIDQAEDEIELARIVVDPTCRGVGIGRAFARELAECAADFNLSNLFVRVLPDNLPAIRCYESAGFARVSLTAQAEFNSGQPHCYVWLKWPSATDNPRRIGPP